MDSKVKREEITSLIDNLKTHSDRLSDSPTIPLLELSVILAKITRLHEKAVILKYLLAKEQNQEDSEFDSIDIEKEEKRLEAELKEAISGADKIQEVEEKDDSEIPEVTEAPEVDAFTSNDSNNATEEENATEAEVETNELETSNSLTSKEVGQEEDDSTNQVAAPSLTGEQEQAEEEEEKTEIEAPSTPVDTESTQVEASNEKTVSMEDVKSQEEEISSKPDLNEQYSEEEDPSLSEQLKKQPIADLLTAIGLNERYLYSNELFGGDIEEFRNVIKVLNDFSNGEEAKDYFNHQLRTTYGWEEDNEMANALYLLVQRRYQ